MCDITVKFLFLALHFKAAQQFQVLELVKLGDEDITVNTVGDLQIRDENGELLTQQWLDDHLDYLNGIKYRLKSKFPK